MIRSVTVVGASLAGVSTARALRTQGFDGRITVVGAEPHAPYDRPPLSKELLLGGRDPASLAFRDPAWYADNDVELLLGTRAEGVDPERRRLRTSAGDVDAFSGRDL